MDEIATSIGRTGKNFSFEYFDFIPDIICISKGLGVGYANLGAVLVSENITNKLNDYNCWVIHITVIQFLAQLD